MGTNNCQKCGACCVASSEETYLLVDLEECDEQRLGSRYLYRNTKIDNDGTRAIEPVWKKQRRGPMKGFDLLVCPSLRGSVLCKVSCAVYNKRPAACRGFKPKKRLCTELREALLHQASES